MGDSFGIVSETELLEQRVPVVALINKNKNKNKRHRYAKNLPFCGIKAILK
jgi:hypothetical protein